VDYLAVKVVHQAAVALSLAGFFARGAGTLAGATWARGRIARSLPHVVDTVLLISAVTLAWIARLNPLATPWLTAKIVGLLVYIALGMAALHPGLPRRTRATAWAAALLVFAYIVSVAITKNAAGLLRS